MAVVLPAALLIAACAPPPAPGTVRAITFPVKGGASYTDTYSAPRSGGRAHAGQDLMAPKLQPALAATAGTVIWMRYDNASVSGNMLKIKDAEGWVYSYVHINNDTPGTDDGLATRDQAFPPEIVVGATVTAGQVVAYVGDSGNAESSSPHLHFEIAAPDGTSINAYASLQAATVVP